MLSLSSNIIESHLFKWSNNKESWREKYFVLNYGVLSYYKNKNQTHHVCSMALIKPKIDVSISILFKPNFSFIMNNFNYSCSLKKMNTAST